MREIWRNGTGPEGTVMLIRFSCQWPRTLKAWMPKFRCLAALVAELNRLRGEIASEEFGVGHQFSDPDRRQTAKNLLFDPARLAHRFQTETLPKSGGRQL